MERKERMEEKHSVKINATTYRKLMTIADATNHPVASVIDYALNDWADRVGEVWAEHPPEPPPVRYIM
ncbi:MAG TPA: hypothetical protein VMH03_01370 [Terriglobales bacterium]|nr:hypothetical protein [Terriglobales bacterium]